MPKWEYDSEKIETTGRGFNARIRSVLNRRGDEEWELCWARELDNSVTLYFKKHI